LRQDPISDGTAIPKKVKLRSFSTSWLKPAIPWLGAALFFCLFFFYPLARILWVGMNHAAIVSLSADSFPLISSVLFFTFYQAILSTLLTLALGLPTAFLFARYTFPGKPLLRALTAIPFMLPTVVVAAGFNSLLGPHGWINLSLVNLFHLQSSPITFTGTLGAILIAHVFYNTTIVIRLVGNSLAHLDPQLEQAARTLGANARRVFSRVTFPLLRPSILAATVLTFIFDFTSFGVILLLGGPRFSTLEVEIYKQAVQAFNLPLAGVLSIIQLICTLFFSIIYSRTVTRSVVTTSPRPVASNLHKVVSLPEKMIRTGMVLLILMLFALPLISLPLSSVFRLEADRGQRSLVNLGFTADYYKELFINRNNTIFYIAPFKSVANSLIYAVLTVILSLALGYPVARALSRPRRLEKILDPLLMLPLGASAVTLGLGFIVSFNKPPMAWLSHPLLVPLAHTLIALPFVIRSLQPALASIPDRLRQAAASLGASPSRVWIAVDWPIVLRAALGAAVFAFTISLGEFGATSLVIRPEYPTLPIAISRFLTQPGGLNYGQAMAMATILMIICGAGILLIEHLRLPGTGDF
jgi:thiamine transport system permease protein